MECINQWYCNRCTKYIASNIIEQQLLSYMARLNYSFKDKYLLTVSARQDGSSVLAEGHKYSWFPSAALAWRISKEKFMNGMGWVNDLKLRIGAGRYRKFSYCTLCNTRSGNFTFLSFLYYQYCRFNTKFNFGKPGSGMGKNNSI